MNKEGKQQYKRYIGVTFTRLQECDKLFLVFMDHAETEHRWLHIECKPPFTAVWGGRELILHDPEGNELLFL